jgi:hypothetical protein
MPNTVDTSLLEAALIGYESERQKIEAKIAELQRQLKIRNHHAGTPVVATPPNRGRRRMSVAVRKSIAESQKKRWRRIGRTRPRRLGDDTSVIDKTDPALGLTIQ